MFSEINSFMEFFENMNKKKVIKILFGFPLLILIALVTEYVDILIVDNHYKKENGHFYRVYSDDAIPWENARINCKKMGEHLATVTDEREQELIVKLLGNQCYWIGAIKDESSAGWRWVTGEKFVYTSWADGEPSNWNMKENVVMLFSNGYWNDINNESISVSFQGGYTKNIYYICEWEHKINFIIGKNENVVSFGIF